MSLVTVFRAFSPAEAQLVRSRLEAAGFFVEVVGELSALSLEGYTLAAGGIRVQVREEDLADARELLESVDGAAPPRAEAEGTGDDAR